MREMRGRVVMIAALISVSCHAQHELSPLDASANADVSTWSAATCGRQDRGRVIDMMVTRDDAGAVYGFGGPFRLSIEGCGFIIENTPWSAKLGDQELIVDGSESNLNGFLAHEPAIGDELWLGLGFLAPTKIRYAGLDKISR